MAGTPAALVKLFIERASEKVGIANGMKLLDEAIHQKIDLHIWQVVYFPQPRILTSYLLEEAWYHKSILFHKQRECPSM